MLKHILDRVPDAIAGLSLLAALLIAFGVRP